MIITSLFILLIFSSVINKIEKIKEINQNLIRIGIIILVLSLYIINILYSYIPDNTNTLINNNIYLYNDLYIINNFNIYIIMLVIIVIICLLSINSSINFNIKLGLNNNNILTSNNIMSNININYINIILFNIIGIILLLLSNNIISIYISIELQSYSLYILTGIISKSHISSYNSLLYYLIGGLGSIIILIGISILYNITNLLNINDINSFIFIDLNYIEPQFNIYLGWLLILFGLFIKIGLAPMYNWSIYIYSNSNTIITSYISLIPKLSILSYIYIILINISINNNYFNNILLLISFFIIISLIIGSIGGLIQIKIKNILAYSGLLNLSYLLLIIINNELINNNNILTYIFYLTQYSLNHISIFLLLIISIIYLYKSISDNNNNNNKLLNLQHLTYVYEFYYIKNNIFLLFSLIIIIGSFIGIPPLLGFYGKYLILISLINNNNLFITILLIISSIISSIYYLYFLNKIFIRKPSINNNIINTSVGSINNNLLTYIYSSIILITLLNYIQIDNILKGAYIISLIIN